MSGQLLRGRLSLHDVDDVEALVGRAMDAQLKSIRCVLRHRDREDLFAYLLALAWELSFRYDPERGWSFSKYAYNICRLRTTDWFRQRFGDSRSGRVELPLGFDVRTVRLYDGEAEGGDLDDRLEQALAGGSVDPAQHRDPDLLRALSERGRPPGWLDLAPSGEGPPRAA